MYRIGQKYKIETKEKLFFTGTIESEDNYAILMRTIRDEELILNKTDITRARCMENGTSQNDNLHKKRE